ncbi:putative polyketide biosynthesis enoyl-CoA hydratase pksH [Burkholderia thailandensis MSMB121]|uniref:TstL n=3 Tax=pseudomallei group TaxID=111527 RepID=R9S779_BURTH|nr:MULTISPECIES: enoyl-CoA hydratase/isomerase [Burkholderia]AGK49872.1 putative polyketide biosynthesis enoyl-CoA hydratase pksH [Burkholderia thailandensis MSMB121]AJY40484.1 putative polyketide biosynthesis enoyl-CoA hydratase pksH [Burkholderia sp. 2002721687]ATF32180.1 enoyl-CoA hydratase [Burkholderia thailandensis]KWZ50353.1 enoyl-CoA hydratase [Burkholderia sp. MSMB1588]AGN11886.1 TstL [Burkholderia humptydooensis]
MGELSGTWHNLRVRLDDGICRMRIERPDTGNAIDARLVDEMGDVLDRCEPATRIVVIEGLPDAFCVGADFAQLDARRATDEAPTAPDPAPLYDLWRRLATGPFVSIAHVEGRANAGGVGFAAACDVVLAARTASFGLSELLFGLMPACVLPYLIRRVGIAKAHYMTLTTQPVDAARACEWGLVDVCEADSADSLRRHLLRLRHLKKDAIARYKRYAASLDGSLAAARAPAIAANLEVFRDAANLHGISRFVNAGKLPWEHE